MTKEIEKLKEILTKENRENYSYSPYESPEILGHQERLLARIEYAVFGNANIQKAEFIKFCEKYPEYKDGLSAYK